MNLIEMRDKVHPWTKLNYKEFKHNDIIFKIFRAKSGVYGLSITFKQREWEIDSEILAIERALGINLDILSYSRDDEDLTEIGKIFDTESDLIPCLHASDIEKAYRQGKTYKTFEEVCQLADQALDCLVNFSNSSRGDEDDD